MAITVNRIIIAAGRAGRSRRAGHAVGDEVGAEGAATVGGEVEITATSTVCLIGAAQAVGYVDDANGAVVGDVCRVGD